MTSNARELAQIPSTPSGRRNLIINGAMNVAQRGTSFGTLSAQAYTLDRWNVDAGATVQQASLAIDEISNDTKLTKAIQMQGASSDYFRTRLEDVTNFSNQTLTLSFYVKGSSATTLNNIYARQNFGSGGSALVDTAFSNISFSVTTSFTRYTATVTLPSISGKTVGTSSFLEIYMQLPDGVTVYLTGVQLEVGSVATEFEHRSFGEELALCQRYYQIIDLGGSVANRFNTTYANTGIVSIYFPVEMGGDGSFSSLTTLTSRNLYNMATDLNVTSGGITASVNFSRSRAVSLYLGSVGGSLGGGSGDPLIVSGGELLVAFDAEL